MPDNSEGPFSDQSSKGVIARHDHRVSTSARVMSARSSYGHLFSNLLTVGPSPARPTCHSSHIPAGPCQPASGLATVSRTAPSALRRRLTPIDHQAPHQSISRTAGRLTFFCGPNLDQPGIDPCLARCVSCRLAARSAQLTPKQLVDRGFCRAGFAHRTISL